MPAADTVAWRLHPGPRCPNPGPEMGEKRSPCLTCGGSGRTCSVPVLMVRVTSNQHRRAAGRLGHNDPRLRPRWSQYRPWPGKSDPLYRRRHSPHGLGDQLGRGTDVEPGEAGALETEVPARTERHLAAIEERRGRVIAQPQIPAVQPRQEGRGARNVADLRQLLA